MSTGGSFASARAMATRCCSPPESSLGSLLARSCTAATARQFMARSRHCRRFRPPPPPNSSAKRTFSKAVNVGTSWKNWKTIPICSPRQCASEFSFILRSSSPAKTMRPLLGRSIPVSILSKVDFPLPEGPLIAKRLCEGIVNVTSSKMVVFWARVSITRERCSTWISGRPNFWAYWFWSIDNFDISFPPDKHRVLISIKNIPILQVTDEVCLTGIWKISSICTRIL